MDGVGSVGSDAGVYWRGIIFAEENELDSAGI